MIRQNGVQVSELVEELRELNVLILSYDEGEIVLDYGITKEPQPCKLKVDGKVVKLSGKCSECDEGDIVVFESVGYMRERTIARMVAVLIHGDGIRVMPD